MIWSIVKILIFVSLAIALTLGFSMIMETPGEVRLAFGARERTFTPVEFVVALLLLLLALWILFKLVGLLVATLRFLVGDETAISRYFDRNRERKGFAALSEGLMALAAGEGKLAQAKAAKAEKLLDHPELTRLLNAQAAQLNGNSDRAASYFKQMLADDRTRFVGVQGLLQQKIASGDTDIALKLAEKAFSIKPRHHGVLDTLFSLQSQKSDWAGARKTIGAKVAAAALPRDVGRRREAVLLLADAQSAMASGDLSAARNAVESANKLAPDLIPAAALAAHLYAEGGDGRTATRIIRRAWETTPHPDLAAAFAEIAPNESPAVRMKRFRTLLAINPTHPETRMVSAELALAAEDFPAARRALDDLPETQPTIRSLALMAAIERGEGSPDNVVRGWLARALGAAQGEAWICSACNHIHGHWVPICDHCDAFDTLAWTQPPRSSDAGQSNAAMLPLIVGALESSGSVEPEDEETDPLDQDAEEQVDISPASADEPEPEAPATSPVGSRVG